MAAGDTANLAAFLQLFAAVSANRAARIESRALKKQGNLAAEESRIEAERREVAGTRFQARQKLGFLKSGVSLKGSPLLVLAETGAETRAQVESIERAGVTRRSLLREKARILRAGGRGQLVGATAGVAATSFGGGAPKAETTD